MDSRSWIGVDLDGTLAFYDEWRGIDHIGDPIPRMLAQVKKWIADGFRVKIFTARVHEPKALPYIQKWLRDNGLGGLEITNIKDFDMVELYDDRAVQVEQNTGLILGYSTRNLINYD